MEQGIFSSFKRLARKKVIVVSSQQQGKQVCDINTEEE